MKDRPRAVWSLFPGFVLALTLVGSVACAAAAGNLRPAADVAPTATAAAQPAGPSGQVGAPAPAIAPAPANVPSARAVAPAPAFASSGAAVSAQAIQPVPTPAPGPVRGIIVSGSGTVSARPDEAIVGAGVQTRGRTAQEAQSANNATMQAVIDAIKALNIPAKDIQTSGVSLYPISDQSGGINGYNATNNVTITVENVDQAGVVLDAAVKAGANQASNVRFTLKDQSALRNKALAAAAAEAKSKADALAAALGLQITGVQSVSEQSAQGPIFTAPRALGAASAAAPSVPIEPGELNVTVEVTVVFSL